LKQQLADGLLVVVVVLVDVVVVDVVEVMEGHGLAEQLAPDAKEPFSD
jgi:hypothetical protein